MSTHFAGDCLPVSYAKTQFFCLFLHMTWACPGVPLAISVIRRYFSYRTSASVVVGRWSIVLDRLLLTPQLSPK